MKWWAVVILVVAVSAMQIASGVWLYARRAIHHAGAGDFVVFGLPVIVAFACDAVILTYSLPAMVRVRRFLVAGVVAFLSFVATMIISLNVYGS